jgi:hypothetical protein
MVLRSGTFGEDTVKDILPSLTVFSKGTFCPLFKTGFAGAASSATAAAVESADAFCSALACSALEELHAQVVKPSIATIKRI